MAQGVPQLGGVKQR